MLSGGLGESLSDVILRMAARRKRRLAHEITKMARENNIWRAFLA
jgi:hypothetical protein